MVYHIHTHTLIDSSAHWLRYTSLLDRTKLCIDVSHAALWGRDPVQSILDFCERLNYVHLQDYPKTLDEIGFDRWVTAFPARPAPGQEDPCRQARRSRRMREYLQGLGY